MQSTIEAFVPTSNARIVRLEGVPLAEARFLLPHALGQEGFAVVSEIDFSDLLNRSLDEQRSPYVMFDVSHAKLAEEALAVTPQAGLLLPCRICLWREANDVVIATLPASRVVEALGYPHLTTVASEIEARLERAFDRLTRPLPAAFDIPASVAPNATSPALTPQELAVLRDAAQQQIRALQAEVAGTESRPLQHAISQNIDQLEAVARKLGSTPPSA